MFFNNKRNYIKAKKLIYSPFLKKVLLLLPFQKIGLKPLGE